MANYFDDDDDEENENEKSPSKTWQQYKCVLNSKGAEDSLVYTHETLIFFMFCNIYVYIYIYIIRCFSNNRLI